MQTFQVAGVYEITGQSVSLVIPAENEGEAHNRARMEGISVTEIHTIDRTHRTTTMADSLPGPRFGLSALLAYICVLCVGLALLLSPLGLVGALLLGASFGSAFGYLFNGRSSGGIVGGISGVLLVIYFLMP